MSIKKRDKEFSGRERENIYSNYNETGPNNPTQNLDPETSYALRPITLENIDEAVYRTFHRRFIIQNKALDLIQLDAEVGAHKFQFPDKYDKVKEYLNLPYFTCWRMTTKPLYRSSPSSKPILYSIPTNKPQGVVYEEYIAPAPQILKFPFVFKFLTTFREHVNGFEKQMLDYFKNKRNLIILDKERFEIQVQEQGTVAEMELSKREGQGKTLYILTYNLDVIGYLRELKDIQKREKPNTYSFQITEKVEGISKDLLVISQTETRL